MYARYSFLPYLLISNSHPFNHWLPSFTPSGEREAPTKPGRGCGFVAESSTMFILLSGGLWPVAARRDVGSLHAATVRSVRRRTVQPRAVQITPSWLSSVH